MTIEKDHFSLLQRLIFKICRKRMSDKTYAEWMLKRWHGNEGSIDDPKTFNEKIQWLKLYDRNPKYSQLVDKFSVRDFVSKKIGDQYLNELYFLYNSPTEINFDKLPDSFVLKATHSSGDNLIVEDKSLLNQMDTRVKITQWQAENFYLDGREWVYKNIPPRIVCERLLKDNQGNLPKDYKVFCFNGEPYFIQVDVDRFKNHTRAIFDTKWRKQEFELLHEMATQLIEPPHNLPEMIGLARELSRDIPFVRIDFYALPEIVFGEMTLYPGNGFEPFRPTEWDGKLGELLELPIKFTK